LRQLLPTRELLAASVAPHRSKLLQVMPPVRSHNRAAAGRQGAKSFMSTALAVVMDKAKSSTPKSVFVMSLVCPFLLEKGVS